MPRTLVDADDSTAVREVTEAVVPLGPQSSQVAIKRLGTNGSGFTADSASALENPTPLTRSPPMRGGARSSPFALVFAFRGAWWATIGGESRARQLSLALLAAGLFSVIVAETAATPQLSADGAVYLGAGSVGWQYGREECRIGVSVGGVGRRSRALLQQFGQRINQVP